MKYIYIILYIIILISCNDHRYDIRNFPTTSAKLDNVTNQLLLDSVSINLNSYSGVGRFALLNGGLVFSDQIFQTINYLDTDLMVKGVHLGRGSGPHEVDNVHYTVDLEGSNYLVIDNFGYHQFQNDSIKTYFKLYDWDNFTPTEELMNNPDGEQKGIYTIDWSPNIQTNFTAHLNDYLFVPIITEHPRMNAFQHERFYEETYVLGKFRIADGKLVQIGGKWSEAYQDFSFIPNLAGIDVAAYNEHLLVSFHIDSLMYVYDQNLQLMERFGVGGQGFDVNYRTTRGIEEAIDNWRTDVADQSFYASVYAHQDHVFRVYHPQGTDGPTRMQIYEDKVLTHDVQVPKRFRVIGKLGAYVYADGAVNEGSEELWVYRFKWDDL